MGEFLEIKLRRCRLFLTEAEIISLLAHDPALWAETVRRGKHILRRRKEQAREDEGGSERCATRL